MREILFRGKSTKTNVWVFGSLVKDSTKEIVSIIDFADHNADTYSWEEVIPESVGQYTGLKDESGNMIFEGDICTFSNPHNEKCYKRIVGYSLKFACFGLFVDMDSIYNFESDWVKIRELELIGNITDNPELLTS